MQHPFQVSAIDPAAAQSLFDLDDRTLVNIGVRRMTVDAKPGFPCRVSLQDAELGEEVLLFSHCHHDVASPYRAAGPVFIRKGAQAAGLAANELPQHLSHRFLSLRGYDRAAMLVTARTVQGNQLEEALQAVFDSMDVQYVHVHNAAQGCYHCRIDRL